MNLPVRRIPTMPTKIQNILSTVYARSFLRMAHHESRIASEVLKTQTNMNGLFGPSQLTRLKLKMRMSTPIISTTWIFLKINTLMLVIYFSLAGLFDTAKQTLRAESEGYLLKRLNWT
jgi:hypothetical protein